MKNPLFIFIILFVCFFHCNAQSKREVIMVKFVESANKSDCNAVIRYGKELYKLNPKDDNVLQIMEVAYFESGKTDSAFYCASEAIKQNPDNYYALLTLGDICFAIKDYEKAEVFYSKVLDLAPGYARAYLNLAKLYETVNLTDDAVEYYLYAVELFHENHFEKEVVHWTNHILSLAPENKQVLKFIKHK